MIVRLELYSSICLFCFFCLSFSYSALATQSFPDIKVDSLISLGISYIINGEYHKAEEIFKKLKADYAHLPAGDIYLAAVFIVKSEDLIEPLDEEKIEFHFAQAESISRRALKKDPDNLWNKYFEALRIGYYSYYLGIKKNYVKAFERAIKAKNLFKEIYESNPQFYESLFAVGSYMYWKSSKLSFLTWTPLLKDEKEEGLKLLEQGSLKSNYNFYLAAYSLFWAYLDSKKLNEAFKLSEELLIKWPRSRFFLEIRARACEEFDKKLAVKLYYDILESLKQNKLLTQINELYYLHKIARVYLKENNIAKAKEITDYALSLKSYDLSEKKKELFLIQRKKFEKLKSEISNLE